MLFKLFPPVLVLYRSRRICIYRCRLVFNEKWRSFVFTQYIMKPNKRDLTRLKSTSRIHVHTIIVNRLFHRRTFRFDLQYVTIVYENYTTHPATFIRIISYWFYGKKNFKNSIELNYRTESWMRKKYQMRTDKFNRNKWAPRDDTHFNAQSCVHKSYTFGFATRKNTRRNSLN